MTDPYNAGQIIKIEHVVNGPMSKVDFGRIVVEENWGRLFIKVGDNEVVVQQNVYPDLRDAIAHFIEPQPDPRDEVIARLVEALDRIGRGPEDARCFCGACVQVRSARAALAAAKAVQHG